MKFGIIAFSVLSIAATTSFADAVSTAAANANSAAKGAASAAGSDVASAAKQNGSSVKIGGIVNAAAAVGLAIGAKIAWPHPPVAIALMGMSLMAAEQALSNFSQAGTNSDIAAQASCAGSTCTTDAGTSGSSSGSGISTDPLSLQALQAANSAKKIVADAASKGISYNAGTGAVNTPNGSISPSQASSAAGLEAAGLSPDDAQAAMDALAAARAAADKKALALRNAGFSIDGSDSSPTVAHNADNQFDFNAHMRNLMKTPKAAAPTVAGLSRKVASGESIGVAGDNIFEMIKRRYQNQRQRGNFLEH